MQKLFGMKRLFPLSSVFDRERATKSRVGRGSLLSTNTDLTHDTRHLCTRLRSGKLKAMPPGFSGSKLFVNTRNRVEFVFSVKQKIKKKKFCFNDNNGKLWVEVIIVTFFGSNKDVSLVKPLTVNFA